MYDYPNGTTIEEFLSYPTRGNSNFWLWILGVIFFIFTFASYYKEVSLFGKGRLISSMVVSAFFVTCLATLGSLVGFITTEILIIIIIFFVVFVAIFLFSGEN